MRGFRRGTFVCTFGALALTGACGGRAVTSAPISSLAEFGEDGSDSNEVEARASALTASLVLAPTATYVGGIVAAAGDSASFFLPRTCVKVTVAEASSDSAPQTVVYSFTDCAGPWGLRHVTGELTAEMTESSVSTVVLHVTSSSLHLDGATTSLDATATLTGTGVARDLAWTSTLLAGTTVRGREFHRSGSWHVGWQVGNSCVSVTDGMAMGDVLGRSLATTVDAYTRCASECPANGGSVTVVDVASRDSITIDYDGSAVADVTSVPATTPSTIDLDCVP